MRRAALAVLLVVLATAAVTASPAVPANSASAICSKPALTLVKPGKLTVGTDNPAYPPWFGGSPGHGWKVSDPTSGRGYESAVAYAVAKQLGFAPSDVEWKYVPFNRSFAPGKKPFDFDINQISYSPVRAKVVTFSSSYYDVNQALVVLKGSKISNAHSIAALRPFKLGAQLGTTSYQFIANTIKPSKQPAVFPQNAGAIQALKNHQIDGLVVDLPTAFYITSAQVPTAKVLGQFPTAAGGEHFGMVLTRGNALVVCVDDALSKLKANGTLARIQQQWLAKATGAPVLK